MQTSRQARIEVAVRWGSNGVVHRDRHYFDKVDFWRDFFPGRLGEGLAEAELGDTVTQSFPAGELVEPFAAALIYRTKPSQWKSQFSNGVRVEPRVGRFYPRGLLEGVPAVFGQDRRPFRYLGDQDGLRLADLNHPLALHSLDLEARLLEDLGERELRGGRCTDIPQALLGDGPGLQAPLADGETDFFHGRPFARADEGDDTIFYAQPRLVQHLDRTAVEQLTRFYGEFVEPGMTVLDLMSSWTSHLPRAVEGLTVAGLGMNQEELSANEALSEHVVQDLNRTTRLPFDDASFDLVLCTVSVEYLVRPLEVFAEVARVLKDAGRFLVTFSHRWFPPKVVQVWTELHPFERQGLVLEYFRRTHGFAGLSTESLRGMPRPEDDRYAKTLPQSDPLFAVWGEKRAEA